MVVVVVVVVCDPGNGLCHVVGALIDIRRD